MVRREDRVRLGLLKVLRLSALLALSVCAPAGAAQVTGWRVTLINQEVRRVGPHGALPLCQAIPPLTIAPTLRGRDGLRVRVRVKPPGHAARSRRVALDAAPAFAPSQLGLRDFEAGAYRLQVRRHGRVLARASLRFTSAGGPC
jgi:hypothetical protein